MDSQLDLSLRDSVKTYFNTFFNAIQHGASPLNTFLGTLTKLNTTIQTHRHRLQKETLAAVESFSSVVSIVSADILELQASGDSIRQELSMDIQGVLNHKMQELTIHDETPAKTPVAAYIKPSYEWLLQNLHNPYPSKSTKNTISQKSKCSVKDIDAWFIDVRKRIGWNKLRKTKFSNKQEKIIAAAHHFFKPQPSAFSDDLKSTMLSAMNPNDAYRADFAKILHNAKVLYNNKFPDLAVFEESMESTVPTIIAERHTEQKRLPREAKYHSSSKDNTPSYPTPAPSPTFVDDSLSTTPPPTPEKVETNQRKRRLSLSSTPDVEYEPSRTFKKYRIESDYTAGDVSYHLPSPSPSVLTLDDVLDTSSGLPMAKPKSSNLKRKRSLLEEMENQGTSKHPRHVPPAIISSAIPIVTTGLKRKRRLSDGESQCIPKRPQHTFSQPRLQTVSNPFPMATSLSHCSVEEQYLTEDVADCIISTTSSTDYQHTVAETYDVQNGDQPTPSNSAIGDYNDYVVNEGDFTSPLYIPSPDLFGGFNPSSLFPDAFHSSPSNIIISTPQFPDLGNLFSTPEDNFPALSSSWDEDMSQWFTSMQTSNCHQISVDVTGFKRTEDAESLSAKKAKLEALRAQVSHLECQLAGELIAA